MPGLTAPPIRSKFRSTSSRITDSLIVTVHIRSITRLGEGWEGSLTVEAKLMDMVSGDLVPSLGTSKEDLSLSRLVLLNWRRCDVHWDARRCMEGEEVAFRGIAMH